MKNIDRPEFNIYRDLRWKILTGELEDGDRLVETSLARQYKVSRLHIKSALRLLEQERLAEYIPQRGFQVKGFTSDMMDEISELRYALDLVTFKRFMNTASEEDMENLRKRAKRIMVFLDNNMLEDALQEIDLFYNFIYDVSGFVHIKAIKETYSDYFKLVRMQNTDETEIKRSSGLMKEMMEAIENKDLQKMTVLLAQR
ncbi:MAG: GntR family transcriptional regulator [Anaerovoracaceae bacterium]